MFNNSQALRIAFAHNELRFDFVRQSIHLVVQIAINMNSNPASLDPRAVVFITFVEILARWRNIHPSNARRILNEMGLEPVRLSGKTLLFRLDELERAEESCRSKLPALRGQAKKQALERSSGSEKAKSAKKQKEFAAK